MAYMARYTKISTGYMGQIVELPKAVTEGETLDDGRAMLRDTHHEMIVAYRDLDRLFLPGVIGSNPYQTRKITSVSRRDLVKYLEENGFKVIREGGNHTISSFGIKVILGKRHRQFDCITADEIRKKRDGALSFKIEGRETVKNLGNGSIVALPPNGNGPHTGQPAVILSKPGWPEASSIFV